jgi:hypothetical protein
MKFEVDYPDEALAVMVDGAIRAGFAYEQGIYHTNGALAEKVLASSKQQALNLLNEMDFSLLIKAAVEKYAPGIVEDVVKKMLTEQVRKAAKELKDRGELV